VSKAGAVRFLNLHEYQSKDLMESYGVVVQPGRMAATPAEAFEIATKLQAESTCLFVLGVALAAVVDGRVYVDRDSDMPRVFWSFAIGSSMH
jgi:hypothetical protein